MLRLLTRARAGAVKPSLDALTFDTTGYLSRGEPQPGKLRVWQTPEGDGLGLYFFAVRPDLPSNAKSVDDLASFCHRLVADSNGKVVEVRVVVAAQCRGVCTILSFPQHPSGRTYLGSLTVPFRDFSFVIKCQCSEAVPTGLKEALLFDRACGANDQIVDIERLQNPGWSPDDPKHDAEFPNHPVARVRRVLAHVSESVVIADAVRRSPAFALPVQDSGGGLASR